MPSVNDLVDVAESLDKRRVVVLQDSCVAVRNRNAHCRACVEVCPNDAISVDRNKIKLAATRCVDCGLCVTACPTEAIRAIEPTALQLAQQLAAAREANDGVAAVACARMAARQVADPDKFTEVPCFGRLAAVDLLSPIADGATGVLLIDGGCSSCKYGFVSETVDAVVESANQMLTAGGLEARVLRTSEFPETMLVSETEGVFGSTRRGFLADTMRSARDIAATAADTAIKKELGLGGSDNIGRRLHVSDEGTLPNIPVPGHESALNALYAIVGEADFQGDASEMGEGGPVVVDLPFFGAVDIDVNKCNACGMCAVFCPTSAIKRPPSSDEFSTRSKVLEFSASDCVQCGLCQDVCWKKSITLRAPITADELFSFEPRIFRLR